MATKPDVEIANNVMPAIESKALVYVEDVVPIIKKRNWIKKICHWMFLGVIDDCSMDPCFGLG